MSTTGAASSGVPGPDHEPPTAARDPAAPSPSGAVGANGTSSAETVCPVAPSPTGGAQAPRSPRPSTSRSPAASVLPAPTPEEVTLSNSTRGTVSPSRSP
ncbi:hypothetical protein [Streptomyces canus]|uniref:hypothetical protein n=1 Tax=Streptomyces canus TaxID=58343 RepID=UPI0027D8E241|nr:hypothetical protein [Streptomyces canus]